MVIGCTIAPTTAMSMKSCWAIGRPSHSGGVRMASASEIAVQHSNGQTQCFATPTEAFEDLRPVAIHSSEARSTRGSYPTSRADLSGLPRKVGGRIEQQHGHQ